MKFTSVALVAYHAGCVFALPSSPEAKCSALGVMDWSKEDLPDYVDSKNLRKCREHPANTISPNKRADSPLQERTCIPPGDKEIWGCDEETGYCWQNCGKVREGEWCWEAFNYGRGAWSNCKKHDDCFFNTERGTRCSIGSCKSCGCGC
ncbi:IDI-2 precursor [Fusarium albosuccineum]|uniref:IDI-2 n=1 Tax=Fusarium albosuccineum TaxID=1237068 RepID=A0A8H4KWP0_9HYPO|nr:IDI-2 precursor [Fusarium albosuccineum]